MKKVLLIVLPILLIAGIVVGLGFAGIINIPGITKKKKPKAPLVAAKVPAKVTKTDTPKIVAPGSDKKKTSVPKAPAKPAETSDPALGDKKLAEVWAEMDPTQLSQLVGDWKDRDLARILVLMEPDKVTALLAIMDAKRASLLSKEIQRTASIVPAKAG